MFQPHSTVIGEQLWPRLCGLSPVRSGSPQRTQT